MMHALLLAAFLSHGPTRDYLVSGGGITSPVTSDVTWDDDVSLYWGSGDDNSLVYDTTQTPDALALGLGTDSERLLVAPLACVGSTDFGLADAGVPTLSLSNAACTDVLEIAHGAINGTVTWTGDIQTVGNLWATRVYVGGVTTGTSEYLWRPSSNKLAIFRGSGSNYSTLSINSLELLGTGRTISTGSNRTGFNMPQFSVGATINVGSSHNNHISFVDYASRGQDYTHGLQTHPTLFFHSNNPPATATDEWLSITHDTSDGLVDVGKGDIRLLDGVEVSGALTTLGGRVAKHTAVADVAYTPLATDHIIGYTSLTAGRIVDPQDATCVDGRVYVVKDQAGAAGSFAITIDPEGLTTIDGALTAPISTNYGSLSIYCDGGSWFSF